MAQDFLIGNEEIEKNGMPMVARSISGSMAGMSGTVTINLVKLSNGSYLYETTNQNNEAIESTRGCARYTETSIQNLPGKWQLAAMKGIYLFTVNQRPLKRKCHSNNNLTTITCLVANGTTDLFYL